MLGFLRKNEEGLILPLAVMLIAIFSLLGFSAVFLVESQGSFSRHSTSQMEALHYAEAGIHAYLAHVNDRQNIAWDKSGPIPFGDGFYEIEEIMDPTETLNRWVKSKGWVEGHEENARTIKVKIARNAFNQYAMFSGDDQDILWVAGEKCYGPYHTNKFLNIKDQNAAEPPTFYGPVTYVEGVTDITPANESRIFRKGHSMISAVEIPDLNEIWTDLLSKVKKEYHYKGLTRIFLKGSVYDVVYYDNRGNPIRKTNVPLPENGFILVDGGSGSGSKFDKSAGNLFISGKLSGSLTILANNEIYITGYPPTVDSWNQARNQPTQGLVYENTTFEPIMEGSEIVGYEANTDKGNDMLGLVARGDIKILGTGWFDNSNRSNVAPEDITIHGAVFSIEEGFGYENYDSHEKGTISLRGSLIQKIRKAVGKPRQCFLFRCWEYGYNKDYAHDPRMLNMSPPNFPEPVSTGWDIKEWIVDPIDT